MLYTWNFLDKKNRWQMWYIVVFSIVIWLVVWWFFTKQYWMSFVLLLMSGLIFYVENNSDDNIVIEIWELWIKIWTGFYDYSKINSYTLIYEWENAVLLRLKLQKKGISMLDLKIDNTIALELKQILPQFIEENEKEDLSFSDKMIRMLKL